MVSALAKYDFWLEYQKGRDNAVADALSRVTTCLGLEAVQAILDWSNHGCFPESRSRGPHHH